MTLSQGFRAKKQSIKVNTRSFINNLTAFLIQVNAYLFIENIRAFWNFGENNNDVTNVRYVVKAKKYFREENNSGNISNPIQEVGLSEMVCEKKTNQSIFENGNEHTLGRGLFLTVLYLIYVWNLYF